MKRSWLASSEFEPVRVVRTKFGPVGVRVWSENRINVEIRQEAGEPFIVNRAQVLGTVTLKCLAWGDYEPIGRLTTWGGTTISRSGEAKLLGELYRALSEETWIEAEFVMADRREVNNDIIRADQAVAAAEKALAKEVEKREELLRREAALGGRLGAETEEPAA